MKEFFENKFDFDLSTLNYADYFSAVDIGEVYIEDIESLNVTMQNDVITNCSSNNSHGFGVRKCVDEQVVYACNSDISNKSISSMLKGLHNFTSSGVPYSEEDFLPQNLYCKSVDYDLLKFVDFLRKIRNFIKSKSAIVHSTLNISSSSQHVLILLPCGSYVEDFRPLVRLSISVIAAKDSLQEVGSDGIGGRIPFSEIENAWEGVAESAIKQAMTNLCAVAAPVGEMPVVLASGWTGVLLHEAIGHGLEADFNRKKTSAFSDLLGEKIASDKVTIVDDGTIAGKRGSINFDDEGTKSTKNILVENGVLKSYMFDRQNALIMGKKSTGNCRRESFCHIPYPRMTNTYMLSGKDCFDDMIYGIKNGIYAVSFSGGQVDITSGKFVFSASEAYLVENGKIGSPIKGVSIIGDGPSILHRVSMVCEDLALDRGVGSCGKNGQIVPVCVGQPSIKIDKITVGGTI